jgi:hypothetical protein
MTGSEVQIGINGNLIQMMFIAEQEEQSVIITFYPDECIEIATILVTLAEKVMAASGGVPAPERYQA